MNHPVIDPVMPLFVDPGVDPYLRLGLGLLVLSTATVALLRWHGAGLGAFPYLALLRAAVQLSVIALLLRGILSVPAMVAAFVVLMLTTASVTAARRLRLLWHGPRAAVAGVATGSATTLTLVFGLGLVDLTGRNLLAVGGIVIGGSMSAATLAGRNFLRASLARADEIEGWLALGATPGRARLDIVREAVREALVPNLDQTKSTGLVTLPGAFVGALFGGASPAVAAQFQLVVLAGLGLAMTVTGIVVTRATARSPLLLVAERRPSRQSGR